MTDIELWTREGFAGDAALVRRPNFSAEFLRVDGPHVPRRMNVADVAVPAGSGLEPSVLLASTTSGVRLSVAKHDVSTTYALRNIDCDEVHFVQRGEIRFRTSLGTLTAGAGDFVCIPRAVTYQVVVPAGPVLSVVVGVPRRLCASRRSGRICSISIATCTGRNSKRRPEAAVRCCFFSRQAPRQRGICCRTIRSRRRSASAVPPIRSGRCTCRRSGRQWTRRRSRSWRQAAMTYSCTR